MSTSFQPSIRTLMGPGSSDVHPRILSALARPTIGHLAPEFVGMMDAVKDRTIPIQSWFLDLNLAMGYWGKNAKRAYHHTAPVNTLYALHESLVMLKDEGLENTRKNSQTSLC